MINILVVDDEPISADGFSIYLEEHGDGNWNILTAYNGMNAMKFAQQRIDVLLTDIMMPGMDGFELQEQMKQRWPMLKTVFLTGNGQLDYAQQAIRSGSAVDYVLKMEDETVVLEAVRKAVAAMEDDNRMNDALRKAEQDLNKIRPMLQKDCLQSILKGNMPSVPLQERFEQLALPLNGSAPALLLVGQLSDALPAGHANDLAYCALDNILEKFLWPIYRCCSVAATDRRIAVFIQAGSQSGNLDVRHVFSLLEVAQQAFSKTMGPISLVLNHATCAWSDMSQHYRALLLTLEQNASIAEDSLVIQSEAEKLPESMRAKELVAIRAHLERGDYEQAYAACKNLACPQTPAGRIALYRHLLKLFSIAVDGRDDAAEVYAASRIPLLHLDESGWRQTQADFALLLRSLTGAAHTPTQRKEDLVKNICAYVDEHLAEDLSLSRMADITFHSATYISKLFVEVKGVNFNNYVVSKRLESASILLRSGNMLLNDIIERVGYRSASYFIHAFRGKYGVTPSEYRKKNRSKE